VASTPSRGLLSQTLWPRRRRQIIFAGVAGHVRHKGLEALVSAGSQPRWKRNRKRDPPWVGNGPVASTRSQPRGCQRWQRPPAQGGGDASETKPPDHHADEPGGQSVPFRGFRGLQESANGTGRWASSSFQSPSGVLGVCRASAGNSALAPSSRMFQSPSGVLGVCRAKNRNGPQDHLARSFSPLPGF